VLGTVGSVPRDVPFRPLTSDQDDVRYAYGPDSVRQDGVPSGSVARFDWSASSIYPGTVRRYWVYVPPGNDPTLPASLVVFLDGEGYLDPNGDLRSTIVLDNLIHHGDLPATIAVFVDPGSLGDGEEPRGRRQRNREYDAFDDRFVTLLVDEILPTVAARWAVTDDPSRRAICGFSSGGNAAFTAGWLRPDVFGVVLCSSSSFAQMPGGNPYPSLLATVARAPLRVFLHVGHRDLGWDEPDGNWLAENLRVAAALAEAGYDFRLVLGDGGHNPNQAGVLLPDALRWAFTGSTAGT